MSGRLLLAVACVSLAGCDFDRDLKNWRAPDAGFDAGTDSGAADAGFDAGQDAGLDGGADGGSDAGEDAGWLFQPDGSYNFAFVTSVALDPSHLTALEADDLCTASARDAGLPGVFGAWIGLTSGNAFDRIGIPRARGWVRPDGLPFADRPEDLMTGNIYYPLRLDEHGVDLLGAPAVGGTNYDGDAGANCSDWSTGFGIQETACPSCGGLDWMVGPNADCTTQVHVYCFGVDQHAQVAPVPAVGPRVFVSSQWEVDGGPAAADEHCNFDAQQLDAGSGFIAFISTTTQSAASRLMSDGGWVRRDGVRVGDLRQPVLDAPLMILFDSSIASNTGSVSIGSSSPVSVASPSDNCNDWSKGQGAIFAKAVSLLDSVGWYGNGNSELCDGVHLICVQP